MAIVRPKRYHWNYWSSPEQLGKMCCDHHAASRYANYDIGKEFLLY